MSRNRKRRDRPTAVYVAYVDGLCEPVNPGGVACYGFAIYRNGEPVARESGVIGSGPSMTNNIAEYTAAIQALRWLVEHGVDATVEVRSDSQLLTRQMQGIYATRSAHLRQLRASLARLASRFRSVRWRWIPRRMNEEADTLSRQAYAGEMERRALLKAVNLQVQPRGDGTYLVLSSRKNRWHEVTLGVHESCTCPAFRRGIRPCKHVVAARLLAGSGEG